MMKPQHLFVFLFLLIAGTAGAATCKEQCAVPVAQELPANSVVIDANTADILHGDDEYPVGTRVNLYVVNMNPFKYDYRVQVTTVATEQSTVAAFFALAGLTQLSNVVTGPSARAQSALPGGAECDAEDDPAYITYRDLVKEQVELAAQIETAQADYKNLASRYEELAKEVEADNAFGDAKQCTKICEAARSFAEEARKLSKTAAGLAPRADKLKNLGGGNGYKTIIDALSKAIADGKIVDPQCKAKLQSKIGNLNASDEAAKIEKLAAAADELKRNLATFVKTADEIDGIMGRTNPYFYHQVVAGSRKSRDINVRIERKSVKDDPTKYKRVTSRPDADAVIHVGESRISITGGIGFTAVEDVTVIRQRGPADDDASKVVERFAEENNSEIRPSVVAMLNAAIGRPFGIGSAPTTFSWSLGIVLAQNTNSTATEYITGPSFGFIDNNLVFTLGYHLARVNRLGGGYKVGDVIPADLKDPLPVEKDWKGGFMLAVSYRLR